MMSFYTKEVSWSNQLRRLGLAAALLGGTALAAHAQLGYSVSTASNNSGTYTDLGTAGTVITTTNTDDDNSAAQNIGFSFTFNSQSFTQFVLNTNGLIRLGSAAPSAANMFIQNETGTNAPVGVDPVASTSAADVNLLAPFNFDLEAGSSAAEYRVSTTGTAPNRVCTIQWKNVHDKAAAYASQYANFSFQLRLYETTNAVEFVYSAPTAATTGTVIGRYATLGIKGSSSVAGQTILVSKGSSQTAWSGATFIAGTGTRVFFRRTFAPDDGRTFRFNPAPANDAAVVLNTLGKVQTAAGLAVGVRAVVTNAGSATLTNVPVTLTMAGANNLTTTQTVTTLAAGASTTITFSYPTPTNLGTSTLTVTVPNDGDNTNNSATQQQLVNTTTFSYIPPNRSTDADNGGLGFGIGSGIIASKFTLGAAAPITSVSVYLADANAVGRTVYGVVLSSAGAILGRSADYVVLAADVNTYKTFAVTTTPATVPAGDFYAGLAQTAYTTAYFPVGLQSELPSTRTGAFYVFALTGGTGTDVGSSNYGRHMIEAISTVAPACAAPTSLAASNITSTSAVISFTDASNAGSYQLQYGPTGFDPTAGGTTVTITGSPYTLTGLASGTTYQVYVRTNCTGGGTSAQAGPVTVTVPCSTAAVQAFPYSQNFDTVPTGQALPCGITVLNANNDNATWTINRTNPYSGTNAMRYTSAITNSQAADDWFFTPALTTTAGTRYQVAFRYRAEGIAPSPSNYTEGMEVKYGTGTTAATQTTTLYSNTAITNTTYALANGASAPAVAVMSPGAGTQYVGFHAISAANQGNLYIDDLTISTVLATTSEALLRAVTVFPNPSTTGLFDLDIHGANAKGSLEVVVTNTLGQRVHTTTARDNTTNSLDLSSLAAGIYHLQVRNGDDFMTRTVSIVK